ncbi:uncharacterized protein BXIN_2021 [Babesia sp. Xinjiang]|uniref:uncharacterized protein n=1 Tax=Babesia sp. Xinjiang TaxID=462227 RepID=UPI000A244B7B|nr:uncharacterized protein BXIN_2021 [Babesia sp. Xinjiang]ORM40307.1 hypothetical protein BXIN_2021 [Babesia sp. Xinjiang]
MVEKEVAIARLQSTLLRLSKDDLIKLLKSTYQAMRIKHGIPFERAESRSSSSPAQRELRGKGAKTPAVARGKRKHTTVRRKQSDSASDTGSFRKVEQPTFRQVDRLTDDFDDLHLSSMSYDSDEVNVSDPAADEQPSDISPTRLVAGNSENKPDNTISDHEYAIQTLKDDVRQLVPPLDFSGIGPSAKEAYKLKDFLPTPEECPTNCYTNVKDSDETTAMAGADNRDQHFLGSVAGYGYQGNASYPMPQPCAVVPGNYAMAPPPGVWFRGPPNTQFVRAGPRMYPVHPLRPVGSGNPAYRDIHHYGNILPVQVRSHSVQRL